MPKEIDLDKVMEDNFSDVVDETPEVTTDQETAVEQEEEVPEPQEETQEEEEQEDDYEAPIKTKKEPEQEEVIPESKAVERAKIEGKRRKELESEKQAWELERSRLEEELESYKSKANELESVRIKPEDHPDYIALVTDIKKEAKDTVDDFEAPNKSVVYNELGTLITKYRDADQANDRDKQLSILKDELAVKMFGEDNTWDLLEKDDRKEVSAALKLLKNSTAKADKLDALHQDLEKRAKSGTLALGVKEYETVEKEFRPVLDTIGDLPEDAIEANPHSIEAQVAILAKTPEGKKRLDNAKRDVSEVIFGAKPLTQSDIEKIEKNGGNVKEYISNQQKRIHANRLKLLPMLVQGLATRALFKEAISESTSLRKAKESEQSEDDALLQITKKKSTATKDEPRKSKTVEDVLKKYGLDD